MSDTLKSEAREYTKTILQAVQQDAATYRVAIGRLHLALEQGDLPAKWRACATACDAEYEFGGDCGGPAGRMHEALGILDCYEPGKPEVGPCAARTEGDDHCTNRCPLRDF